MIQLGLRLHDAEKLPVEEMLPKVRQQGFVCAHRWDRGRFLVPRRAAGGGSPYGF